MADELTIPLLPCPDLDEAIAFYEALGFTRTYRQQRPNPYAVVAREDLQLHLFGVDGFDPETSLGNVLVVVPDPDALYAAFAAGLRARFGKLPATGIPRITRPRKQLGTVRTFSVIDPGGNWLRVSRRGDQERDPDEERPTGLARAVDHASRLGDAKGDAPAATDVLTKALARFPDAPAGDVVRALLYRGELHARTGDQVAATGDLDAARAALDRCTDEERSELAADVEHLEEIAADRR